MSRYQDRELQQHSGKNTPNCQSDCGAAVQRDGAESIAAVAGGGIGRIGGGTVDLDGFGLEGGEGICAGLVGVDGEHLHLEPR